MCKKSKKSWNLLSGSQRKRSTQTRGNLLIPFFFGFLVSKIFQNTRVHICMTTQLGKMTTQSRTSEHLSATLAKSGPLDFPSEKVFFYFLPMKRVQDTCFKNSLVVFQFSFFASPQAKNHFSPGHPCEQRSKV